jgi:two-component system, chemotaxis family, CheB/CheR fusion protein
MKAKRSKKDQESRLGKQPEANRKPTEVADTPLFPIVGVGASAGGLEAFTKLLKHLPADIRMGFVLVQHLALQHPSMLTELLSRTTKLPVTEVKEGVTVEPGRVYVIPPNTNIAMLHGTLRLMSRETSMARPLPIDYFFTSLATDRRSKAIGVILSGSASDGTLGMKAIKAEGGITFAQDDASAKFDSMPRSAIAAGFVDFVLPPEKIAVELERIARHPYFTPATPVEASEEAPAADDLHRVFILLRAATGVDFSHYKPTTINRRINRRMVLHNMEVLPDYIRYLQDNRTELQALYQDILINVTSFFREPESFEVLKRGIFPKLIAERPPDSPLRIWVPGCSTGEEAYSIAICVVEFLSDIGSKLEAQIFATDISELALEKARAGRYAEGDVSEVSPDRLRRFFSKTETGYLVNQSVRDICIFARQNVIKDLPSRGSISSVAATC